MVAGFAWNGWQPCRGPRGSVHVDWVAAFPWIGWQASRGLSGNLPMDWVADIRGICTHERVQREVDMLIALGASLRATKGYAAPEVEQTYTRARQLCHSLHDPHQLFPVLRGLYGHCNVRAEYQTAQTLGEQLLALAQQVQDAAMLMMAHRAIGQT